MQKSGNFQNERKDINAINQKMNCLTALVKTQLGVITDIIGPPVGPCQSSVCPPPRSRVNFEGLLQSCSYRCPRGLSYTNLRLPAPVARLQLLR